MVSITFKNGKKLKQLIVEEENKLKRPELKDLLPLVNASTREITRSLEKIREGTYGKCDKCRQPIEEQRLLYHPQATHCINCAE